MKHHARMAPGETIDDGRDEARTERRGASDPHLTRGWVGKEFDVLNALPQLVESCMAAIEHGAPVFGELDAVRVSVQETHPESLLQLPDRARDDRVGDSEFTRRLRHAPGLRDR